MLTASINLVSAVDYRNSCYSCGSEHTLTLAFRVVSYRDYRDVHGIRNPNGTWSPMVIPWEWDKN